MKMPRYCRFITTGFLVGVLAAGCAAGPFHGSSELANPAFKISEKIQPLLEKLYLYTKDLDQIRLDVRADAHVRAFLPGDPQLNYVQKAASYVEHASLIAMQQWELLSIVQDIKPEALIDYYTLRHKALGRAFDETRYDAQFLGLYQPFVERSQAKEDIQKALNVINDIQAIYSRLIEEVAPLVRQGLPTSL